MTGVQTCALPIFFRLITDGAIAAGVQVLPVPALGDDAVGLSARETPSTGAAHRYMFRKDAYIVAITMFGPAGSITLNDALGLAVTVSAKVDRVYQGTDTRAVAFLLGALIACGGWPPRAPRISPRVISAASLAILVPDRLRPRDVGHRQHARSRPIPQEFPPGNPHNVSSLWPSSGRFLIRASLRSELNREVSRLFRRSLAMPRR